MAGYEEIWRKHKGIEKMKFMRIQQYLNEKWIELIKIEVVVEEGIDEELEIQKALFNMKDIIFEHEKVTVYSSTEVVIFNRLDGPVKIDIVTVDDKENENEFIHL